ncbi:MAG: sigma 54-interacting transcriptional regulator [Myxococcaceae bacterium]
MALTVPLEQTRQGPLLRVDGRSGHLRARRYQIVVVKGPDAGKSTAIEAALSVGSGEAAGFRLTDPTVSGDHLELTPRADGVRVRDLESTNGTFVGGARVSEVLVEDDTLLTVGKTQLRIAVTDDDLGTPASQGAFGRVLGQSGAMQRLFGVLHSVSPTDSTIVLMGETGTGKELIAEAIHQASLRKDKPFVVVDCGSIAPALVTSELFGHAQGAFPGAVIESPGAFQEADGGTLFLDEIGELPLDVQPMLLRVLEAGTVKRLGESRTRKVDVRIIAATHRDLEAEVERGAFRQDLYFRLAVAVIRLPPLRQRLEDLPLLIDHFVAQIGRPNLGVSERILERFRDYAWPGNLRELRNLVERALAGADALSGSPTDTPGAPALAAAAPPASAHTPGGLSALPFKEAKEKLLEAFTRDYLEALLARADGNISRAAKLSGLTRAYLHELVARHGLRASE